MKDKEIKNINNKKQYHGYQEWFINNKSTLRGNFKNNKTIAYVEYQHNRKTYFYIR